MGKNEKHQLILIRDSLGIAEKEETLAQSRLSVFTGKLGLEPFQCLTSEDTQCSLKGRRSIVQSLDNKTLFITLKSKKLHFETVKVGEGDSASG